jgi:hypothetical protein
LMYKDFEGDRLAAYFLRKMNIDTNFISQYLLVG